MNYELRVTNKKTTIVSYRSLVYILYSIFFFVCSFVSFSQVKSSIDSTKIKIGELIIYKIEVESHPDDLVVFPEGQTFMPLEMIDSYPIDTIKNKDKYNLIKKYGLTQFDSGTYTIPRQKIIISDKIFLTDSLNVEVNTVVVDTLKQGLYDIKPIIEVKKSGNDWWKYLLYTLLILAIIGGLLYWFIWRKKPLSEAEQIAMLPPYDRAKLALKKLDESNYLENEAIKDYYSELTFIIRRYLDEKVYDKALESTTDELINRLTLLKEANQIEISKEDIRNLESILKRADLVKFAKSAPDIELAKMDRNTIDMEIDHVKEALPEPTEEEKLLDAKYKEKLERKAKRKKIIITVAICVFLLLATITAFSIKYGFTYVKDTILGHDTKELLEGEWVTSDYGFPPITLETPEVLKRVEVPIPDDLHGKMKLTTFALDKKGSFTVVVSTNTLTQAQDTLDINNAIESNLKNLEAQGARNILTHNEKFTTPNGAEGVKTSGTMQFLIAGTQNYIDGEYILLSFVGNNQIIQQITIAWARNDVYGLEMADRIVNSVELQKDKK